MTSLRRPSDATIRDFLAAQEKLDFTYPEVGATATTPPSGYVVDHTRVHLGDGEPIFHAACAALQCWKQFDLGWVEATPRSTPIQPGAVVAIVAHRLGVWWLNACKIVYVVAESEPIRRFGLAYGTWPDHAERGEERFLIEWDPADNRVWYDILDFSQPNRLLTRIGYPLARRTQRRFARDSAAAMLKAVQGSV